MISKTSIWRLFPPHHTDFNKEHGRLETRQIWTATELNDYVDFPYVGQVLCIHRESIYIKTGKKSEETVYGITSLTPDKANPGRILQLNRDHWGIENRSHYVRDVTFDEDHSQIRTKNAPRVMASIRNFVISIFRFFGSTNIAKTLRAMARKPFLSLQLLRI